ncbi:MAG: TetR family transcriptional regulator [Candidatus Izemoplasmatales bacterium]|jgi:AcrR family transcriptional regulator|nr:TetR family transcriptional regulator [Candidatus Izemoplasmatales bacterium]
MPKQTFMNLSEEKKAKIFSAAKSEFSTVSFSKASINQIIKDAKISRGSFYMYFEDKYDLIGYMLSSFQENIKSFLMSELKAANGDLTKTVIGVHDYLYHLYEDKENQGFVKNMILFFQSTDVVDMSKWIDKQPIKQSIFRMTPLIDLSLFAFQSEDDIKATIDIIFSVLKSSLVNAFVRNLSLEESKRHLESYLRIIQFGYQRRGEK